MKVSIAIIALVGVLFVRGGNACSCAFSHPQDHFCWADFVIRATIDTKRYIYRTIPKPEPTTESPSEYSSSVDVEYEPVEYEPVEENLAEVAVALEPRKISRIGLLGGLLPPAGLSHGPRPLYPNSENRPIDLEYTVKVQKVYKGNNYTSDKTSAKIHTAPEESLCGKTGLAEGTSYILSGTIRNNKLHISYCGWNIPYKSLTKIQKRGLKWTYKQSCDDCRIASCYGSACKYAPRNDNLCMFDSSAFGDSCEVNHSVCSRSKKACKWQGNREFKQCTSRHNGKGNLWP